jgi:hypothetical protein
MLYSPIVGCPFASFVSKVLVSSYVMVVSPTIWHSMQYMATIYPWPTAAQGAPYRPHEIICVKGDISAKRLFAES